MAANKYLLSAVLLVLAILAISGCTGTSTVAPSAGATATATANPAAGGNATSGTPPSGTPPSGMPPGANATQGQQGQAMPPGSSSGSSAYTLSGVYSLASGTASETGQAYSSIAPDVSAVYVSEGAELTLTNPTIDKSGDTSSDDNSNFYGLNAGVLAASGSNLTITGGTITTDANGANGVFSTGTGTTIYLDSVTIRTSKDSSRGVDVTYGGTIIGNNLDISTQGAHCAAIASDRGEGTQIITGGTMTTAGEGSPGIYSTGNFTVTGATITATGSEAAVIEGKNSITLIDTIISGAVKHGVMIYQSTSGDAGVGTGTFRMTGGSLTAAVGPLFYVTNTNAVITLSGVTLSNPSGILLKASTDSWGTAGSNGGIVTFTADNQTLSGDIVADSLSSISATLQNGTTLTGAIDSAALSLDSTSTWHVTGTSNLTGVTDSNTTLANIDDNGHTIYYDSSLSANSWLNGQTYDLVDGGKLTPK